MASKLPSPHTDPNYLSPEECRELFGSFLSADPAEIDTPEWQTEILKERMTRYCKYGVHVTPFEEFERELLEELMKG